MKYLNLLPKSYTEKQRIKKIIKVNLIFVLMVFLLIPGIPEALHRRIYLLEEEYDFIREAMGGERLYEEEIFLQTFQQEILQETGISREYKIDEVIQALVTGIDITEINYTRHRNRIEVTVLTQNRDLIPLFTDNLNSLGFGGVYLLTTARTENGFIFSIEMFVN